MSLLNAKYVVFYIQSYPARGDSASKACLQISKFIYKYQSFTNGPKQGYNSWNCKVSNDLRNGEVLNWSDFNGIPTRDLRDTGAMLYIGQLSYELRYWKQDQLWVRRVFCHEWSEMM